MRRMRTLATLALLVAFVIGGSAWGWQALTQPFPERQLAPASDLCVDTPVASGSKVTPAGITVSVANASGRSGLAGETMEDLTSFGFGQGKTSNAPDGTEVDVAEVWVGDEASPAAALVRTYVGPKATIKEVASAGNAVVLVLGENFRKIRKGKGSVTAARDATVCSPVVPAA
jgi:hypothetical protein